ncbi:MAG TPA: hypothetical protein VH681_10595 [Nitrospiraceae bacterium]
MSEHELEKLLGGFAADTLTHEERQILFTAALQDQQLFNALADEQALKELLADPGVRRRLLQALRRKRATGYLSWLDWFRRPVGLAVAGGLAATAFAVVLGTKVYQDSLQLAPPSVATEESQPATTPPSTTATLESQPPPSEPVQPQGKAPENLPPATAFAKKDTSVDRMASREQLGASQPEQQQESAVAPDAEGQKMEQDKIAPQADMAPSGLGKTTHDSNALDTPSPTPAAPDVPKSKSAPLARSLRDVPITSARALFYATEPDRVDQRLIEPEQEAPMKSLSETRRALRSESKNERFAAAGAPTQLKPLGLRYGFAIRNQDGTAEETDVVTALNTGDQARLTIEVNQEAYVQIWKTEGSSGPELWFPTAETGQVSIKVPARRRQGISLAGESDAVTLTVRMSRMPLGLITEQEAAELDVPSNQIQETITPQDPVRPEEDATYVVNRNPSPVVQLIVEIPLSR